MLQQDKPDDYVIATGTTTSVRELVRMAFECVDLSYEDYVCLDNALCRPAEVDILLGNPTKAKLLLGWKNKIEIKALIEMMVRADYNLENK